MAKRIGKKLLSATSTQKIDGKLQPQAIELEEAVLGALMIDNESLSDTIDSLQPEYFYKPDNQKIFEEIPYALFLMKILYFYLDCFLSISITGSPQLCMNFLHHEFLFSLLQGFDLFQKNIELQHESHWQS